MFDVQVIRKTARDYPAIISANVPPFLEEAGAVVEADAKLLAPVDTGNLRGSIARRIEGNAAVVGTNVEYAQHVEYGTVKMQPRAYMRGAIDRNRRKLIHRFAEMIRGAIRG